MENANVSYRRKIDELERELESSKIEEGAFAGKRIPKVARSYTALLGSSNIINSQSTDESFFVSFNDENKEN